MWSTTTLHRHRIDLFRTEQSRLLLIFLPDRDGESIANRDIWTKLLTQYHFACVCPDGQDSWWLSKIDPQFDPKVSPEKWLTDSLIPWARDQLQIETEAIAIAGIGMGGQGALRIAMHQPMLLPAVAGLESILDLQEVYGHGTNLDIIYESRERCRQDSVVLQLPPHHWPATIWIGCNPDSYWLRANDRLVEKMKAIGIPHVTDFETRTCGHSWDYYDAMAPKMIRFVGEALLKRSRSLI